MKYLEKEKEKEKEKETLGKVVRLFTWKWQPEGRFQPAPYHYVHSTGRLGAIHRSF